MLRAVCLGKLTLTVLLSALFRACDPGTPIALPQDLGVDTQPRLQTLTVEAPAQRKAGMIVKSVAELVEKLHKEAKVI